MAGVRPQAIRAHMRFLADDLLDVMGHIAGGVPGLVAGAGCPRPVRAR